MTSPYLLRPLRTLAEVSRAAPANREPGKTPVSVPNLHAFLHSFIARYPANSEGRPEFARSTPQAEIRAKSDSTKLAVAKPARLVWTNDALPARTRRQGRRVKREESEG